MTSVQRLFNNIKKIVPNYFDDCVGYTKEELGNFEKTLGFQLPDAIKEFYGTMKLEKNYGLGYCWNFCSLETAISYRYGIENAYSANQNKVKLNPNSNKIFQIITEGSGSSIYLDFDPDTEGTFGQLVIVFRDYSNIVFYVSSSFEEFLDFLSEQFESNKVTIDEDIFFTYEINAYSSYSRWIDLSHKNISKKTSNNLVNLSEVWLKSIRNNWEFLDKPLLEMVESDLDRIYYVDLFKENLDSIEVLALFPNIAIVNTRYISGDIVEILAKTRVGMLNSYAETIDFKHLAILKYLVDIKISCKNIENIEYLSEFKQLKSLTIKADFTSEQEKFYQNHKEINNISESL